MPVAASFLRILVQSSNHGGDTHRNKPKDSTSNASKLEISVTFSLHIFQFQNNCVSTANIGLVQCSSKLLVKQGNVICWIPTRIQQIHGIPQRIHWILPKVFMDSFEILKRIQMLNHLSSITKLYKKSIHYLSSLDSSRSIQKTLFCSKKIWTPSHPVPTSVTKWRWWEWWCQHW